jgi:thiol-disulfide isomerase/thioredoxin
MKKSLIVLLAALAGAACLAFGIAAPRVHNVISISSAPETPGTSSSAPGAPSAGSAKMARGAPATAQDSQVSQRVIRFANNPQAVPPFLVNDLDGNVVSTAALRGKVVLLNFWATWCPPCREEIPELIDLANRYKDGLQVVGISMDDADAAQVKDFATRMGMNYPVVMGGREIITPYGGVPGLPTTYVINRDGRIVQKHVGLYPTFIYEDEIRALLDMKVDATVQTFEDTGQIFLKNAAHATALPGVEFAGLTPEQKKVALKRLNSEGCDCGCRLTLAQCRINDTSCPTSRKLAAQVVKEVTQYATPSPAAPTPSQNK